MTMQEILKKQREQLNKIVKELNKDIPLDVQKSIDSYVEHERESSK